MLAVVICFINWHFEKIYQFIKLIYEEVDWNGKDDEEHEMEKKWETNRVNLDE